MVPLHRNLLANRESLVAAFIFVIAAYLILFNLGYAPLWHDESPLAVTGKNIVLTGGYNGWDGRNVFMTLNGASVNSNLKLVSYPPWQAIPSALGIAIFGANEVGVRFFHALLGLFSILIFWQLLRLDFAPQKRLRLLALTLFALSAQTILFMRIGRYAADAIFFTLLAFYCYRLYIGANGKLWHLVVATLAAVLGFLNHYAIGSSIAMAIGVWHLLYYARETSRRQWIEILGASLAVVALCITYLFVAGIIGTSEKLEFTHVDYEYSWFQRHVILIFYNFREMLHFGWLPLWVAVWFFCYLVFPVFTVSKKDKKINTKITKKNNHSSNNERAAIIRWSVLLALFLFFSGLVAVRPAAGHELADSRYLVPALPLCALIIATFVNWLWRQRGGVFYAVPIFLSLLVSNALSFPYLYPNLFTQEKIRFLLPQLIGEIHRPYIIYLNDLIDYLNTHAEQDDTIFVSPWQDYSIMQFYFSEKLIFCCALNEQSGIPKEKIHELGVPLFEGDIKPVWQVVIGERKPNANEYKLVFQSEKYSYPTQRPELEFHTFRPLPKKGSVYIYRRRY